MDDEFLELVYAVVSRVPAGRVATYGQIAGLAGYPRRARHVGRALRLLPVGTRVPWHRIVNARGEISPRSQSAHKRGRSAESEQRFRLEAEGIELSESHRVDLAEYQWRPRANRPRR